MPTPFGAATGAARSRDEGPVPVGSPVGSPLGSAAGTAAQGPVHRAVERPAGRPVGGSVEAQGQRPVAGPVVLLRLVAWFAVLGAGVALVHGLGGGILEAPPTSPGAWSSWWAGSDPVVATMALIRLVVLGLGWYLLVATLLALVAHVSRSVTLWRLAELVTARSMRELVAGLVGVALVSATAAPASASPTLRSDEAATPVPIQLLLQDDEDRPGEGSVAVDEGGDADDVGGAGEARDVGGAGEVRDVGEARKGTHVGEGTVGSEHAELRGPTGEAQLDRDGPEPDGGGDLLRFRRRGGPLDGSDDLDPRVGEDLADDPPTDRQADRGASQPTGRTERGDAGGPSEIQEPGHGGLVDDAPAGAADPSSPGDPTSPTDRSTSGEHVVEAGESFWLIASELLARAGEPIDDRTVERYWRVLIEANHDRLVVAGDPDLILPGQRLRVPPIASVTGPGVAP